MYRVVHDKVKMQYCIFRALSCIFKIFLMSDFILCSSFLHSSFLCVMLVVHSSVLNPGKAENKADV